MFTSSIDSGKFHSSRTLQFMPSETSSWMKSEELAADKEGDGKSCEKTGQETGEDQVWIPENDSARPHEEGCGKKLSCVVEDGADSACDREVPFRKNPAENKGGSKAEDSASGAVEYDCYLSRKEAAKKNPGRHDKKHFRWFVAVNGVDGNDIGKSQFDSGNGDWRRQPELDQKEDQSRRGKNRQTCKMMNIHNGLIWIKETGVNGMRKLVIRRNTQHLTGSERKGRY